MAMSISRREFFRDAGGLLLGFNLLDSTVVPHLLAAPLQNSVPPVPATRLDAWLKLDADGIVRVFTGKVEIGMGVETALSQIVAEELDVPTERVSFVMGDTARTTDVGGVGGSTSISQGARPLRNVAATARRVLLQMASQRFGVPLDQLQVSGGMVSAARDASKRASYGELAGGSPLNDVLKTSGQGFGLNVEGSGTPKDPRSYTVVGAPVLRRDIPPKVFGQYTYVTDIKVPGMLHGRVIRPTGIGATFVSLDESAAKAVPGFVRTVVKGNFVGVAAESEWGAIRAAKAVKVTWSAPTSVFTPHADVYHYMRTATPKATRETVKQGDASAALAGAARKIEASYDFPFQSHATMGPGCAVADVSTAPDGITTVWTGAQKPHAIQRAFAELLGVPLDRVRIIWAPDAGSYGRAGFEDTAGDAVLLSQALGRPVRVQWMRDDMTAWGPKGPAVVCDIAAGLDAHGNVTAIQFTSRAFSGNEIAAIPGTAGNYLAAQLAGVAPTYGGDEFAEWGRQTAPYVFPTLHAVAHIVPSFASSSSPLRATHLRDPEGPAASFAAESFIDELAAAAGVDPLEFRLKHIDDERARAVLTAAAEKAGWTPGRKARQSGDTLPGRGIALSTRNGSYVGTIADVEVNRRTGAVRVTRFVCAHDCGLIINPSGLKRTIEANLIQSLSRTLKEETTFDRSRVTSADWVTYPVARASDIPAVIDIVLVNRPDLPPGGAGEPSSRNAGAAIANAVFDATGVRMRQVPLTPARIKAALSRSA
jgi:CO/xanthine dehydrogenase Mo-binding subunit